MRAVALPIGSSGLKNEIKAFIWNQGESNVEDSILDYKTALEKLYKDFKTDYTFEKFYLVQTPPGCNSKNGHQNIREAQRQFAKTHKDVKIMTRHGFPSNPKSENGTYFLSDGCHYHALGYEVLGKWISNMAKYDFYGATVDFEAPQVIGVTLESSTSLVIEFDKAITIQPELIIGGIKYDLKDYAFAINNKRTTTISNLAIDPKNPKRLRLNFSNQSIYKGDTLTYILADNYPESSIPYQGPWLTGVSTGVGALGFTEVVK
ncbi:sialate O-acetylesterase [Gelidibacter sp.]|uniref:sialate O-acetylesterase n=1 Tax=Gelidibacter sp. TaxID=2018083 RepID=UPI002C4B40AB|nr:sialate O-acetylesterase [Gelidibacter sp.]HUH29142.1 sialate O-acetylesterase [Gelidibacter sp.]